MKNQDNTKQCSNVSIRVMLGNLAISVMYLLMGTFGHSIAALSEGIDSLTDAVGSLLLLLGFKVSARKADSLHPNGHKRFEYIIGLLISEMILFAAFSLGKQAITGFHNLGAAPVSTLLILTSIVGALGKLMIAYYINRKNKQLESPSLKVYYRNTLADLKGICFVAGSAVLQQFTSLPVDAVAGLLLAALIGLDGFKSFFENVSLLIGEEKENVQEGSCYANR